MAKRIKIKGKTPRGLSKTDRRAYADAVKNDDYDLKLSTDRSPRNISSTPSSTRKKRVKEGSPKFIGPRTRESIMREAFDEGSRQLPKVRMAEDDSQPIGQNDEIYRRLGEMLLRKLGSRPV